MAAKELEVHGTRQAKSACIACCKDGGFGDAESFSQSRKIHSVGNNNNSFILPFISTKELTLNIIKYVKVCRPLNITWELKN